MAIDFTSVRFTVGLLLTIIGVARGFDFCHSYLTCGDGYVCCGDNDSCCLDDDWMSTAAIIGLVVGGLIFLAVVIGVIIALIMCCSRSKGRSGNVVNPGTAAPVQVITTGYAHGYGQPSYQYPPPPVYPGTANQAGMYDNPRASNQTRVPSESIATYPGSSSGQGAYTPAPQNPPAFHKQPLP